MREPLGLVKEATNKFRNKPTYLFMHHPPFDIGIPYMDNIAYLDQISFYQHFRMGKIFNTSFMDMFTD